MEITTAKERHLSKYYIIKNRTGYHMIEVSYRQLELFLETAGDLIVAVGDTKHDAQYELERYKRMKGPTRKERFAEVVTRWADKGEMELRNMIDWIRGRGWR